MAKAPYNKAWGFEHQDQGHGQSQKFWPQSYGQGFVDFVLMLVNV